MHPTTIPCEPGCLVRLVGKFSATQNRYAITLWVDGDLFSARWVSVEPPSLQALLGNLAAFPIAWQRVALGQPPVDEYLS